MNVELLIADSTYVAYIFPIKRYDKTTSSQAWTSPTSDGHKFLVTASIKKKEKVSLQFLPVGLKLWLNALTALVCNLNGHDKPDQK